MYLRFNIAKAKSILLSFAVLLLCTMSTVQAQNLEFIIGNLPPYAYEGKNGEPAGVFVNVTKELQAAMGDQSPINSYPWARAIDLSFGDNKITFPLYRLPFREEKYIWLGPFFKERNIFMIRSTDNSSYQKAEDFLEKEVGVVRGMPSKKILADRGFKKINEANSVQQVVALLESGRIDAWYDPELMIKVAIKESGKDASQFKLGLGEKYIEVYYGMSLNLADIHAKWQTTLDKLIADGVVQKYLDEVLN